MSGISTFFSVAAPVLEVASAATDIVKTATAPSQPAITAGAQRRIDAGGVTAPQPAAVSTSGGLVRDSVIAPTDGDGFFDDFGAADALDLAGGVAGGLGAGLAADARYDALGDIAAERTERIRENYRGTDPARNLRVAAPNAGAPTPTERWDNRLQRGEYRFDKDQGRIVFVKDDAA